MAVATLIRAIRANSVQIQALAFLATELWRNGRERVRANLKEGERRDFLELTRRSRGRPGKLSERERRRFAYLVRKAATGEGDDDWLEVAKSLPGLLPPAAVANTWARLRKGP